VAGEDREEGQDAQRVQQGRFPEGGKEDQLSFVRGDEALPRRRTIGENRKTDLVVSAHISSSHWGRRSGMREREVSETRRVSRRGEKERVNENSLLIASMASSKLTEWTPSPARAS